MSLISQLSPSTGLLLRSPVSGQRGYRGRRRGSG